MIWYGHHHLVLVISISEAPSWSPSSPARHLDLHSSIIVIYANLMLLRLSLPLSDKVKQLQGICISYSKATTIWLLLVADNFGYKTWTSHTTNYISSCLDHITSQQALQKQVRRHLLRCCKFYVAATGLARTVLTYASKPQWFFVKCGVLTFNKDRA